MICNLSYDTQMIRPFDASLLEEIMRSHLWTKPYESRRSFIGGSDARIIMGSDEAALVRLWQEKRGEAELEDLSRAT